ncbi:MAG: Lpg1974 family pore-forming outer membrane protein [Chlamydiota bacterium]|jgi:hypothetical protein
MKKHVILWIFFFFSSLALWGQSTLTEGYNKPNGVSLKTNWSFHLDGSFIYWYTSQDGLNLGISNQNNSFIGSRILKMDFDYEPGFILGSQLKNNSSGFDIYFTYTRLHFVNNQSQVTSFFPIWLHEGNTALASSAKAKWNFKLDLLDLEFARSYHVGKRLTFRTYVGLRSNILDQKFNVDYTVDAMPIFSNNQSDSWSIGPKAGLNTNWYFTKNFSALFAIATSILYTDYKVSHNENNITNFQETIFSYNNQVLKVLRPTLEMEGGINWGINFNKDRCHFFLSAKYNFQVMFNQNVMRETLATTALDTTSLTDLYLHGLTLKSGFDF